MPVEQVFYTISEQIIQQIKNDIFEGKLQEGESLREVQLAKKYNVSRGPIRDALKVLAKEGFLTARPNVGVKVAPPPTEEVLNEIKKLRRQLEVFALQSTIDKFEQRDFDRLNMVLERMYQACIDDNYQKYLNLDISFHTILINKYEDKHLVGVWNELIYRMMFNYKRLESLKESCVEHEEIVKAIQEKDLDKATKLIEDNIR